MIELEKEKEKIETKYGWQTLNAISLLPLVGVNLHQPLRHMFKIMVHIYSTYYRVNLFENLLYD